MRTRIPLVILFVGLCISSLCSTAESAGTGSPSNIKPTRRNVGYLGHNPVLLVQFDTSYSIQFALPDTKEGDWRKFGADAWLLATNGAAVPTLTNARNWSGPGEINGTLVTDFAFRRTREMAELYAVVLRMGEKTYVFRVPSAIPGLSEKGQFLFDMLTNLSVQDQEDYEARRLTGREDVRTMDLKAIIEGAKRQLKELGVEVKWDAAKKCYAVANSPSAPDHPLK